MSEMNGLTIRLAGGFAAGIGFAAALALAIWGWSAWERSSGHYNFRSAKPAGLNITTHREIAGDFGTSILGTVTNTGATTWENIMLVVELLDEHGEPLDICNEYLSAPVAPSSSGNFKVTCGEDLEDSSIRHSSYTVRIDSANRVSDT